MSSRFLLSFDQDFNINVRQVPITCCAIDPKNNKQAKLFIDEWVPIELIPDLMEIGLQRLSRQFK